MNHYKSRIGGSLLTLLLLLGCETSKEKHRLNVLWLVAEDLSPYYLNAYGDARAPTPNLDRLANEGVVYTHNFSVSGVCAPSRATLATGLYPNAFGAHNMRTISQEAAAKKAGIINYQAVPPQEVKMVSEIMREQGYYTTNNSKEDYQFFKSELAWDESSAYAHWRNRPYEEMPFFAVFNAGVTHESSMWYHKARIDDYEDFPPGRDRKEWWKLRGFDSLEDYENHEIPPQVPENLEVEIPPYLPQNEVGANAMRRMYANIVRMDRFFGRIIDQLEADGLLEKTIIFWFSDHGGPLPRQKRLLYDSGLHTPLMIRFPNKERAGERDDRLISFVDFPSTLLSLANIEPPSYMQGQAFEGSFKTEKSRGFIHGHADRFDESIDMIRAVRNKKFKYLKNFYPEKPYYLPLKYREKMDVMQELLKMRDAGKLNKHQALWFKTSKPNEELFDIENDPHELNNIADDPNYAEVLNTLREECLRWMTDIDDKGLVDERELIELFYPNGNAQLTAAPKIEITSKKVSVSTTDTGVRVGYRYRSEKAPHLGWKHYTQPIDQKVGDTLEIITHRLGFKYGITTVIDGIIYETNYPLNAHDK